MRDSRLRENPRLGSDFGKKEPKISPFLIPARGCIYFRPSENNPGLLRSIRAWVVVPPCRTRVPSGGSRIAKGLAIYMSLVTGTTECTALGEPFGGSGGGGSIPAVNDARVLILHCDVTLRADGDRTEEDSRFPLDSSWLVDGEPANRYIARRRKFRLPKRAATTAAATPRRNKGSLRSYEAYIATPYGTGYIAYRQRGRYRPQTGSFTHVLDRASRFYANRAG